MPEKKYNFIFEKLVSEDADLIGFVAYSIYKRHKIEFITEFKKLNSEKSPTESDCEAFRIASTTPSQIEKYKNEAESMLQEIVGTIAKEEVARLEMAMLKNYKQHIKNALPSMLTTIWQSILGALAFSIIVSVFYFVGSYSERGKIDTASNTITNMFNLLNNNKDQLNFENKLDSLNSKRQ